MTEIETVRSGHVVIGVDTHKHIHVAAVMDSIGGVLATLTISTDTAGFRQLLEWAVSFGKIIVFGIEGTGSYGAGLTSFVRRHGHKVIEVSRPDRRLRRLNGKSDTLDAENAARAVLAGFATAVPKTADGVVEMIRQLKVAHDTAVKDRTGAMITLKAMLVHATEDLRRETAKKTQKMVARHCAALRPRGLDTPEDANRHALRSIANAGSRSTTRSRTSKHRSSNSCSNAPRTYSTSSGSASIPPRRSSSSPATTPSESRARQRSRNSPVSAPSLQGPG